MRLTTILVATTCSVLAIASAHAGPAGSLDPGFGTGGSTRSFVDGAPWGANAVARQPDGKIIVAGVFRPAPFVSDGVIARYLTDGSLDLGFGTGGSVVLQTPGGFGIRAVALQSSGKIVATDQENLRRYDASGAPDLGFGTSGVVELDYDDFLGALAIYPDDRIVIAGARSSDGVIARFDADGAPDATFGSGGEVIVPFTNGPFVFALALQPDGAIVLTGKDGSGGPRFLLRCDASGLDPTFGSGGIVSPSVGELSVAIQPDGAILSGGSAGIGRYDEFGDPDPSFTPGAMVNTQEIVVQPNGKIVGLGGNNRAVLTRYEANGTLDPAFGLGGIVREGLNEFGNEGLLLEPGGSLVVAGSQATGRVARYFGGTCGDGNTDDGEECDDGNLVSGDGCDAHCCLADGDADGVCDSNDPCTSPQSAEGSVRFTRLLQGGFREQKVRGSLRMGLPEPVVPALDPLANGLRLVLDDASGRLFDVTIPGGAFADPGIGWSVNPTGTKWQWKDRAARTFSNYAAPAGIDTIKIAQTSGAPLSYKVVFKGRGNYGYLDYTFVPPLSATVVFDTPTAQGGQCGAVQYAAPQCALVGGGGTLLCR